MKQLSQNKELSPLEALKEIAIQIGKAFVSTEPERTNRINELLNTKQFKIIETALKVLEIIKELFDFDFAIRYGDNQPMIKITNKRNGQYWELPETTEICNLLKEVFE